MAVDQNEAAKRALIAYRQLNEIVKEPIGYSDARAHLQSYNRILATLNDCFSAIDKSFADSVKHLQTLGDVGGTLPDMMESDGKILLAARGGSGFFRMAEPIAEIAAIPLGPEC
jgi:hypothetical protein